MMNTPKKQNKLTIWIDLLAITAWGILLLKYWLTGELNILIHPDYFGLVVVTGFAFILIGIFKTIDVISKAKTKTININNEQHITFFAPGVSSILLLIVAIIGLSTSPKVFSSQTAIQRGIGDSVSLTRTKPQKFRANIQPEERSIIDWVRTLNSYPEPDAYIGQKVKVQGFVVYPEELSEQYLLISRFVITCCAADAYPVGLPVKLSQTRKDYSPDTWLEIQGEMITENLAGKRQLVIQANSLKQVNAPVNPYDY